MAYGLYLERTLQYFSVSHWFTNNENISVKGKNLKFKIRVTSLTLHNSTVRCTYVFFDSLEKDWGIFRFRTYPEHS